MSSGGSEIQAEDGCSNSSRERDSPSDCLSPGPPLAPPSSSSFGRQPPPSIHGAPTQSLSLSSFDLDRLSDEHLRAKRARVENIIRGMSHSPVVRPNTGDHSQEGGRENETSSNNSSSSNDHRGDGNSHTINSHDLRRSDGTSSLLSSPGSRGGRISAGEVYRENKRKQRLPQQQHTFTQLVCSRQEQRQEERRQLKLQLEDMQVGSNFYCIKTPKNISQLPFCGQKLKLLAAKRRFWGSSFHISSLCFSETTASAPGEVLSDL